ILTLLKNVQPNAPRTTVSIVAATPKPRIVKLAITPQGEEPFRIGESKRRAMHYVVKVELGGGAKLIAPLLGKQPPDIHVWILGGEAPAFVKSEGPLYLGGPILSWSVRCGRECRPLMRRTKRMKARASCDDLVTLVFPRRFQIQRNQREVRLLSVWAETRLKPLFPS